MWVLIQICGSLGFLWAWFRAMRAFWSGWRDEPSISEEADFDRGGPIALRRTFTIGAGEWLPLYDPLHGGFTPVRFVTATKALFVTGGSVRLRGTLEWSHQTVSVTIRHSWPRAFSRAMLLGMAFFVVAFAAAVSRDRTDPSNWDLVKVVVAVAALVVVGAALERLASKTERRAAAQALPDLAKRFHKDAA